ncbi:hypothetical protein NFI96_007649 [Prochilodus magdalenae]|nr:hypothetical protein NFI96_007649 [Prochilodus magdalenae]
MHCGELFNPGVTNLIHNGAGVAAGFHSNQAGDHVIRCLKAEHLMNQVGSVHIVIRKFRPSDHEAVRALFREGTQEHINPSFMNAILQPLHIIVTLCFFAVGFILGGESVVLALLAGGSWIAVLYCCCYELYAGLVRVKLRTDMRDIPGFYLNSPDNCFWVAEAEVRGRPQIMGMVAVEAKELPDSGQKYGELFRMIVSPAARRTGLGSQLCKMAMEFCKERGFSKIVLQTMHIVIRKFRPSDHEAVRALFRDGIQEYINPSFMNAVLRPLHIILTLCFFAAGFILGGESVVLALLAGGSWIAVLYCCCYEQYAGFVRSRMRTDMQDIPGSYLNSPDNCFWVAEAEVRGRPQIIGTVAVEAKELPDSRQKYGELLRMVVLPTSRRTGLGSRLCKMVMEFCKERGFSKIVLETTSTQTAAVALYKKMGFTFVRTYEQVKAPWWLLWLTGLRRVCLSPERRQGADSTIMELQGTETGRWFYEFGAAGNRDREMVLQFWGCREQRQGDGSTIMGLQGTETGRWFYEFGAAGNRDREMVLRVWGCREQRQGGGSTSLGLQGTETGRWFYEFGAAGNRDREMVLRVWGCREQRQGGGSTSLGLQGTETGRWFYNYGAAGNRDREMVLQLWGCREQRQGDGSTSLGLQGTETGRYNYGLQGTETGSWFYEFGAAGNRDREITSLGLQGSETGRWFYEFGAAGNRDREMVLRVWGCREQRQGDGSTIMGLQGTETGRWFYKFGAAGNRDMHIVIRKFRPSDYEAVTTLFREGTQEHINPSFTNAVLQPLHIIVTLCFFAVGFILGGESVVLALLAGGSWTAVLYCCCYELYAGFVRVKLRTDMQDIPGFYLSSPDNCFWVAEAEVSGRPQIIGMVAVEAKELPDSGQKYGELLRLIVSPAARRTGLGSQLCKTAMEFCKERGFSKIVLQTTSTHAAAVALYKKMGFTFVDTNDQLRIPLWLLWVTGVTVLTMEKNPTAVNREESFAEFLNAGLHDYLTGSNNAIRLMEIQQAIIQDNNVFQNIQSVSTSTIDRGLKCHQMSMKQLYKVPFQRNGDRMKELRTAALHSLHSFTYILYG